MKVPVAAALLRTDVAKRYKKLARAETVIWNCIIENTGTDGIFVNRVSLARIINNTIQNNPSHGVMVSRNSVVMVGACLSSGVNLGRDTGSGIFEKPNRSDVTNNGNKGIRCANNSYANGRLGTLNGSTGAKSFTGSCIDSLI